MPTELELIDDKIRRKQIELNSAYRKLGNAADVLRKSAGGITPQLVREIPRWFSQDDVLALLAELDELWAERDRIIQRLNS